MSGDSTDVPKKHRHDLGQEDHGAVMAQGTTKAIQAVLGLWIALTFALVLWALVDASRPSAAPTPPAAAERAAT
jgi:type IV secretory pathway TrbD component